MLTVAVKPAVRMMPFCWKPLKPGMLAVRRYSPGGSCSSEYTPPATETCVLGFSSAVLVAVTVAPCTSAPDGSVTTPVMLPATAP
jgi:hypothetical protein